MTHIIALVLLGLSIVQAEEKGKIECYANPSGSKLDPNNIYTCTSEQKCCQENGVPTCCSEKPTSEAVVGQAQLWGTLAGLILVMGALMWYCRHDGNWCGSKKKAKTPENDQKELEDDDTLEEVKMMPEGKKPTSHDPDLADLECEVAR
ncbi:uncharacterized protein [Procambarus clarkii]|uniref:uncharacterized protein n=1 Tax=Procambarus clarkii TaxID=6728 RepID=UPI001E6782F5|nr:uncharacterized protein LOC123768490 [Procambarus clarkii]